MLFSKPFDWTWYESTLDQLRSLGIPRKKTSEYFHPLYRSAVYSHKDLRNWAKRQEILELNPGTKFKYDEMTDDNIDSYWYVGVPMKIYPTYQYHLTRNRASNWFEREGSFVANFLKDRTTTSPPPLLLLLADRHRKKEYIDLKGKAIQSVQQKFSIFDTNTALEEEDILAQKILHESLPDFLARMADVFVALKELQNL